MPFLADPFTVRTSFGPGIVHGATFWATPPARADGSVADDAEHVRPETRIDAMDAHRPDDDAVPEHGREASLDDAA